MKRIGNLFPAVAEMSNLRLAFWKAARGQQTKAGVRAFRANLDQELMRLRVGLLEGTVALGDYHFFTIQDPKQRTISAASFSERVLHHALMNVCEPVFERVAIYDSYACRKGKGSRAAVKRAQDFCRRCGWFLKMDVRKYFDSVDHSTLRLLLRRKFKDEALVILFDRIIGSYHTSCGKGLPIGNLTSQHFANFYLSPLDRFVRETLRCSCYVRYMDDFVIWANTSKELQTARAQITRFLSTKLGLALKEATVLNRTSSGMDFLGFRLWPGRIGLSRRSKRRFLKKFRLYEARCLCGDWSECQLQRQMEPLLAFVRQADTLNFRKYTMKRFGAAAIGLEPREPRWQLEQFGWQLPVGEPQQQRPIEPEPQPGLSGRSSPQLNLALEGVQG